MTPNAITNAVEEEGRGRLNRREDNATIKAEVGVML